MRTQNAEVELTAYSPSVVRVRIAKGALGRDFSYAVTGKPQVVAATITQDATQLTLSTGLVTARVSKQPFAITFTTIDGKVINQDEPGLGTSWIGEEVTTYKKLQAGERFIGLGEKGGNLDRRGSAYTNWNTDAYAYTKSTDPLYASIPFYIGVHNGLSYGIFFDNSYRTDFNFGASNDRFSSFGAQGGEMDYYFIHHPQTAGIVREYTALTGRMPLPPLWSLGYQQNRYSYYPEAEVMRIAQTLREKKIPADGITLDVHYMDAYKLFTWDKSRFPDPSAMTRRLAAMGFRTTVIVDPGIKIEKGYGAYERGLKDDIFLKYADGSNYSGEVWPGWCHFPDFTAEAGRAWWRKEVRTFADAGVAGLWNDMNEISTWGQAMPNNVLFGFDGAATTHKEGRNVYALQMTRASYEGMKQATGKRPFMLTRAGFAGLQRYTAIWTGDNTATEEHMLLGVRLLNSLGVSGVPFAGMDVGGFSGSPTASLYARWMALGAFTPYFRNHAEFGTRSSEPWTYGDQVLDISRKYIGLRYRLMPYLYSAFHDASATGEPVMRTLAIDYTHDPRVYLSAFQHQYLFGKAFLVAPFESTKEYGKVYFPPGKWYDLHTDEVDEGGRERVVPLSLPVLPVWVKEGSIVPMQSLVQSTSEKPDGTLSLHIWKGEGNSSATYYEDDGESYAYEKGGYYRRMIGYDGAARRITVGAAAGSLASKFGKLELVLHGFGDQKTVTVNGTQVALARGTTEFSGTAGVLKAVINNERGEIAIAY
ncbi:glycoside hydrolase family 31 protein [Pseudoduganella sp. GCM10020061]|uniref:glycoside hydrolase family 31 protein n=1 Tax=Pseudoduganella sp. GCM10020061 TaxID=3317345 RepID=UPI0036409314